MLGNGITHGLHETIDQRALQVGAGRAVDPAGRNETILHGPQEFFGKFAAHLGLFNLGQCVRNARTHLGNGGFTALGVFFKKHLGRDGLRFSQCNRFSFKILHGVSL